MSQARFNQAEGLFQGAFMAAPDAMALLDGTGHIMAVNAVWRDFACANGGSPDGYVNSNYLDAIQADADPDQARIYHQMSALLAGERERLELEYPCHSPERPRWFLLHAARFEYDGGGAVLVVHLDITARRLAEERAREAAARDPMTGLLNRRSFSERAQQSLEEARRSRQKLGLLFIDLNGFKQINDQYGHTTGDQVLIQIGQRLQGAVRDCDATARIGGDEFVVICPDCPPEKLNQVGQRIHEVLAQGVNVEGIPLQVGCCVGTAVFPDDGQALDELLLVADRAMYRGKAALQKPAEPEVQ